MKCPAASLKVTEVSMITFLIKQVIKKESPHTWMPRFQKGTNIIYVIGTVCRFKALCREWHHGKTRRNVTNVKV
jgi:hypothetical protein